MKFLLFEQIIVCNACSGKNCPKAPLGFGAVYGKPGWAGVRPASRGSPHRDFPGNIVYPFGWFGLSHSDLLISSSLQRISC